MLFAAVLVPILPVVLCKATMLALRRPLPVVLVMLPEPPAVRSIVPKLVLIVPAMSIAPLFWVVTEKVWLLPLKLDDPRTIDPVLVKLTSPLLVSADTGPEALNPVRVMAPVALKVSAADVNVLVPLSLIALLVPVVVRPKGLEPELEVSRFTDAGTVMFTAPVVLALKFRVAGEEVPTFKMPLPILIAPEPELRFNVPPLARFSENPFGLNVPLPEADSVMFVVLVVSPMLAPRLIPPAVPPVCNVIVAPSIRLLVVMPLELVSEKVPVELICELLRVNVLEPLLLMTNAFPTRAVRLRVDAFVKTGTVLVPMLPEVVRPEMRDTVGAESVTPPESVTLPALPFTETAIEEPGAVTLPRMSMSKPLDRRVKGAPELPPVPDVPRMMPPVPLLLLT